MRKMFAGESQPSNGLAFPQITRSAGIFLALRADIKIRRLTSIKTFFSEEINQKP